MVDKPLVRHIMTWAMLPAWVLAISGVHFAQFPGLILPSAATAAEMPQDEFEQHVKNYLLAHPEVVGEALNRLEAKRGEQAVVEGRTALKAHADEIFKDPNSPVGGNPNGDVTLVEFFDYNCPYCKVMAPLMTKATEADPKLRIVYKEFPILGAGSVFAAKAALAANKQGKYESFHLALYQVHGSVGEAKVLEVARTVGLDVDRLKADMQDKAIGGMLDKNVKLGEALHLTGTPGFVAGEQVSTGARDLSNLQAFVAQARNGAQVAK